MARREDRDKAIALRKQGMSYSQIKEALGINKSTLHYWLVNYPLSELRIRELRDNNAQRIERFRATMLKKREDRLKKVLNAAGERIGILSDRDIFLAGIFLYWAEGSKTQNYTVALHNTDPGVLLFFRQWLRCMEVPEAKVRVRLQIYTDMDATTQTSFWAKTLGLRTSAFNRVQMKKTETSKRQNYKGRFGFGTCSLVVYDRDLYELIMSSIAALRSVISEVPRGLH